MNLFIFYIIPVISFLKECSAVRSGTFCFEGSSDIEILKLGLRILLYVFSVQN